MKTVTQLFFVVVQRSRRDRTRWLASAAARLGMPPTWLSFARRWKMAAKRERKYAWWCFAITLACEMERKLRANVCGPLPFLMKAEFANLSSSSSRPCSWSLANRGCMWRVVASVAACNKSFVMASGPAD